MEAFAAPLTIALAPGAAGSEIESDVAQVPALHVLHLAAVSARW